MYGSWNTDISGTSVDSGAVVIGPKSTAPSWICWATSRSPPSAPEWWWTTLILPPVSSPSLSANCWAASDVPCLGGLTLPITSSFVWAWAVATPARVKTARISSLSTIMGDSAAPRSGAPGRRPDFLEVLREASYRRLFVSGLFVNVARWMDLVTLGWLALQLTGSPFFVGLAAFARTAPLMVVGPFTGIVADRVSRARVLVVAQGVAAATALLLALVFGSGLGGYGRWSRARSCSGWPWTLDFPARRTALYSLLGAARVAQAVSLETVSMQVAKIVGPLLAGACLARLGPAASFALMAAGYAGGLIACRDSAHACKVRGSRDDVRRREPARGTSPPRGETRPCGRCCW